MRPSVIVVSVAISPFVAFAACTTQGDGPIGTSSARLSATTNYNVTSTHFKMHETSIASAQHASLFGGYVANWVIGFNNCDDPGTCDLNSLVGWAYSSDSTGASWTANVQTSGTQFGSPPERNASDGNAFAGMLGDPSLTPIYDSSTNNNGRRVLMTNLGNSTGAYLTDAVVLLSDDGGHTWGNPHYVNTTGTGLYVDNPVIASHSVSPYSTYVAWSGTSSSDTYINSISYGVNDGGPISFTAGTPSQVDASNVSGGVYHPAIAMGQLANCDGTHEAVYVAWESGPIGRCPDSSSQHIHTDAAWWFAVYDTVEGGGTWYGPWEAESDSNWPNCVGSPLNADGGDNDPRPRLAVQPSGTKLWIAHTQSSTFGTTISVDPEELECADSTIQPITGGGPWQVPFPCYQHDVTGHPDCNPDGGGGNGPDGGIVINDEWGPAIAYLETGSPAIPELVVTWYDTRGDQSNNLVNIQGAYTTDLSTSPFNNLFTVSQANAGENVPWDHTLAAWWDYQALGTDLTNSKFLAAWGGDARDGASNAGIWSSLIQ